MFIQKSYMGYNIKNNAVVGVIGYGSWATALVHTLEKNCDNLWWHIRNEEVLESMTTEGKNAKYLSDVEFDTKKIHVTPDINEVVRNSDVILLATPSAFLKSFLQELTEPFGDKFILSATKGIIAGDYKTVTEYIHDTYNIPFSQTGVISGPSHAEEVSRDRLSYLTVACSEEETARWIGGMFASNSVRIAHSKDIYGVEYAAILKNIYAIAGGLASGLGFGDNFKAVLIANCAREMTRFLQESYPFERDTMAPAYLGDLLVTAYSSLSRNRRFGLMIGHGVSVKGALNEMTMVAEGYFSADCIKHINQKFNVYMPITDMVYDILYNRANPRKRMRQLSEILK